MRRIFRKKGSIQKIEVDDELIDVSMYLNKNYQELVEI